MPANVYLVAVTLSKIANFEVVTPDEILVLLFPSGFTETGELTQTWVEMNAEDRVLISNLGMFYLVIQILLIEVAVWSFLVCFSKKSRPIRRMSRML